MRTLRLVLIFGALWLLIDVVFSWLAFCDPHSGNRAEQGYYNQEQCSAFRGPLVSSVRFLGAWLGHGLHEYGEAVIAIFTVILALSTIALWRSTERLWQAGERQIEHLERTAERQAADMHASIEIAKEATAAANLSADVAVQALIATDRAWITVSTRLDKYLLDAPGEACWFDVTITIKNEGRAPALNVSFVSQLYATERDALKQKETDIGALRQLEELGPGLALFPGQSETETSLYQVEKSELARARKEGYLIQEEEVRPILYVCAYYSLPTSADYRHTVVMWEIEGIEGRGDVKLRPSMLSGSIT